MAIRKLRIDFEWQVWLDQVHPRVITGVGSTEL
jgi:hypothetical protein